MPEIVSAAIGSLVAVQLNSETILALSVAIILFYFLIYFAERA